MNNMITYNKLVRDNIPTIIEEDNKTCRTKILTSEQFEQEAKKKLYEELDEYMNATNNKESLEELADILELIHALTGVHDASFKELEAIRVKKKEKRGGFDDHVFLIDVDE